MSKKDKKSKAADPEVEATPSTNNGLERVISRASVQPNWKAFSAYVEEAGGPKINPKHVGIVLTGYKYFQKSDSAVSAREEAAEQKNAAKAERDAAREARQAASAAKAEERAEAKAAREKTAADKAAKAKKSPAKASKAAAPSPKASAGKATAKKAAAKKTTAKGKGKSAF